MQGRVAVLLRMSSHAPQPWNWLQFETHKEKEILQSVCLLVVQYDMSDEKA